ncbi:Ppx/GppA phosphatase [Haliscomenobacter hydrossis]|uniref:Ppx/GppA phosphatase n=1 Tax=Haliscomenobacter hydrossis (strain ATCC 27775 / DSM 1100 / LMG 10767 / O) TaxID=760192 RepID=F4L372_HALH1|nr:Ppx/GppA phosphatase [Haliscomenobacter hydrossis]AEE51706.1 Ppx/GppA phosphatase [Haliscomenobacter hydrossis DSM 1100]
MTLAIIDLGTNIFHLRIVKVQADGSFLELFRRSQFIKLAADGIGTIGPEPFQRGLTCIQEYAQILVQHQADQTRAIGTAAMRTASNGSAFIQAVKETTGLEITLIDGDQEAHYIHRGVEQAVQFGADKKLIMDIGGGSVEFIIADLDEVYWAQSFPVGMAVLYRNFHQSDPISTAEIADLRVFLSRQLTSLQAALNQFEVTDLVGTRGTFDVLVAQFSTAKQGPHCEILPIDELPSFFAKVTQTSLAERSMMPEIPADRIDMIVVGMLLIQFVLEMTGVPRILVSDFDVKEGVLAEMAQQALKNNASQS